MLVVAHRVYDGIHAVVLPVQRIHIPLNGVVATGAHPFNHVIVVISIGRAEQKHFIAGQLFDLFMHLHYLVLDFTVGNLTHILVIFAVISQIVPLGENHFHILRVVFHPASCHKKGDFYVIFPQYFHNLFCVLVAPGGIKGECNLRFVGFHTIDGKFPSSHTVAHGSCTAQHTHHSCGKNKKRSEIEQKILPFFHLTTLPFSRSANFGP